ncbi:hypothetical protein LEP1GSC190_19565 (plasmid) [Leptospira mayottensis 200901116]|nr:hypothetical protein LEP1GSC190_19565 [Leptospira mayottensis 200901116]
MSSSISKCVGGAVVSIYSRGAYRSGDIDLEPVSKLVVLLNRNYLLVKWTNIIQRSPMHFGKK